LEYNYNFDEREYNIDINNIIQSKHYIRKKYNNFLESKKIKDDVKLLFTEIFNDNNDVSKKLYEELMIIIDDYKIENNKKSHSDIIKDNNY
jgi:hypothetical protein